MKILFFSNSVKNYLEFRLGLIKKLIENNNEIFIIIPNKKITKEENNLTSLGVNLIRLDLSRHGSFFLSEIFLFIKIYLIYRKIKPDYALHFTIKPNIYGSIICKILKINCINNITGLGTVFINKKFYKKLYFFLYKLSLKNSYHSFFQNQYDLRYFRKHRMIQNNYSLIPGSGVDIDFYTSNSYPSNNEINFLFIGRLIKEKGIYEYLEAADNIKFKFKNVNFYIAGSYDELNISTIDKKLFNKCRDNKSISYLGYIENIRELIEKNHAIILPSYREGMSHSLLVAGAMSRPMIVSDVPGCKELVNDNFNGFIFKPKNTQSLIESIIKFINLPYDQKKNMGFNSRLIIKEKYDENIVINNYLQYIK